LIPIKDAAVKAGNFTVNLVRDTLHINKVKYTVDNLDSLPPQLKAIKTGCLEDEKHFLFFKKENPLSNHYPAKFTLDNEVWPDTETYFQSWKAKLAGKPEERQKIKKAGCPVKAKKLGNAVKGLDEGIWEARRVEIMTIANRAKFSQNPELLDYLLATGTKKLVEASPNDKIWGIGMSMFYYRVLQCKHKWGDNLFGDVLETLREYFAKKRQNQ